MQSSYNIKINFLFFVSAYQILIRIDRVNWQKISFYNSAKMNRESFRTCDFFIGYENQTDITKQKPQTTGFSSYKPQTTENSTKSFSKNTVDKPKPIMYNDSKKSTGLSNTYVPGTLLSQAWKDKNKDSMRYADLVKKATMEIIGHLSKENKEPYLKHAEPLQTYIDAKDEFDYRHKNYTNIDGDTAILASLFNPGHNKQPHANPKPNHFGMTARNSYYHMRELLELD